MSKKNIPITLVTCLAVLIPITKGISQLRYRIATNEIHVLSGQDTLRNAWSGGSNAVTLSSFDFDFDGQDDLLVFDRQHNKSQVFIAQNGHYAFSPNISASLPSLRSYAFFYDYDKDGRRDLFTATQLGIKAFRNQSSGNQLNLQVVAEPITTFYAPSYANMDISTLDVPSFSDVDNDGDMDILHFKYSTGISVIWERNMSMEKYGKPDSLDFKQTDDCWGSFNEQLCKTYYFGFDCTNNFRLEHVGAGAVLAIDMNNDGSKDVLIGKEDCFNLNYLQNKGTPSAAFFNQLTSSEFPSISNPIDPLPYPMVFYEDVDFDGNKDLIASTGSGTIPINTDLSKSIWWYKNTGSNTLPVFTFQSKNFLQNTMIDLGRNTHPAFADKDGDGDLDLFVGNSTNIIGAGATLSYYENIGTSSQPTFALRDTNYLNLSTLVYDEVSPTFTDLNNDNRSDLVLVSQKGTVFKTDVYINQSSIGLDFTSSVSLNFPLTSVSSICFYDMDNDLLKDGLIGNNDGYVSYYRNTGTIDSPVFTIVTDSLGEISAASYNPKLSLSVSDINQDTKPDLITVDDNGLVNIYSDFQHQNTPFVGQPLSGVQPLGQNFSLYSADLTNDNRPELIFGNDNGGLQLFISDNDPNGLVDQIGSKPSEIISLYPNPNNGNFEIVTQAAGLLTIYNVMGLPVYKNKIEYAQAIQLELQLPKGVYFASFNQSKTKKIVIDR